MGFQVPSFEQSRDQYLTALRALQPDAPIDKDSDNYVRASSIAAVAEQLYAHGGWVARQVFPDLADVDVMESMANQRGVVRKAAVAATGNVRFAGTPGTNVPIGTLVECPPAATAAGVAQRYVTTAAGPVAGGGTVDLATQAVVPGEAANLAGINVVATLPVPIVNITGATILSMTGGIDTESDDSLLDRLLFDLRNPPAGGNAADYQRWAREVPGVRRAFVYPLRRGDGTVDVAPFPATGIADAGMLAAVQVYIDARRPVGRLNGFNAIAPTTVVVPVTAIVTLAGGYVLADVVVVVTAKLQAYFDSLAPGDTVVRAKLIALISDVPGVLDVVMPAPAANVPTTVSAVVLQVAQLGAVGITSA